MPSKPHATRLPGMGRPQQRPSMRRQDALRHALPIGGLCPTGAVECMAVPRLAHTEAGKAAIRASRTKRGRYSAKAIEDRRELRALLRHMRELLGRPWTATNSVVPKHPRNGVNRVFGRSTTDLKPFLNKFFNNLLGDAGNLTAEAWRRLRR